MRREVRVHQSVLAALSGATLARLLECRYLTEWPFAWTPKGWRWFQSAMGGGA